MKKDLSRRHGPTGIGAQRTAAAITFHKTGIVQYRTIDGYVLANFDLLPGDGNDLRKRLGQA